MNEFPGEEGSEGDALSPEVRAFLARAQRSHDVPGPEVKQRVRAAVGVALVAAPLGAAPLALNEVGAATKLAARWTLGAKLGTTAVLASLVGTGGWLLPQLRSSYDRSPRAAVSAPATASDTQPVVLDAPTSERAVLVPTHAAADEPTPGEPQGATAENAEAQDNPPLQAPVLEPTQTTASRQPSAALPATSETVVDRSELSLLMAASGALDAGDAERGLALLTQHRTRFPASALDQERRGLSLVARCLRTSASGSEHDARLAREAKEFLRRYPGAVLTARIRRTCAP